MNFQTITCLTGDDVRQLLAELVQKLGRPNKLGGRTGGQTEAAKEIGIGQSQLNEALSGRSAPPKKVLQHFGLETRRVYVKGEGGNE